MGLYTTVREIMVAEMIRVLCGDRTKMFAFVKVQRNKVRPIVGRNYERESVDNAFCVVVWPKPNFYITEFI